MATPTPTTLSTEPIGSVPIPIDLIERVAKADREDPTSRLSMKMPFRRAGPFVRTRQELALVRGRRSVLIEARCDRSAW
jgi:hypothetical protein